MIVVHLPLHVGEDRQKTIRTTLHFARVTVAGDQNSKSRRRKVDSWIEGPKIRTARSFGEEQMSGGRRDTGHKAWVLEVEIEAVH
jgi:hypothetical protein